MSAALAMVRSLAAAGVEFSTDGERIRWCNGEGWMTPEIVAVIAAEKAVVIGFLTGKPLPLHGMEEAPSGLGDADAYARGLRLHGPTSYGVMARALGWGATRAWHAEDELRRAGRIAYDRQGRGRLVGRSP